MNVIFLFLRRLPRSLNINEYVNERNEPCKSIEDLQGRPIFKEVMMGNPRIVEYCAALMEYLKLFHLEYALLHDPSAWPPDLPQRAISLLNMIQTLQKKAAMV